MCKLVIKLIDNVADVIAADPVSRRLRVIKFVPD